MINNDFKEFLQIVVKCLTESKITYVIVGGLVSTIYGRPRTTLDIDVIIEDTNENIKKFQSNLRKNGFDLNQEEILITIQKRSHYSIFHSHFPYRIDLQGVYSALDERSIKNRVMEKFLDLEAFIEKPEDLIIAKLVYGSQQDLEDAKAIIMRQKEKLDMNYLEFYAKTESVREILDKVLEN